jgi:hypothetical protein
MYNEQDLKLAISKGKKRLSLLHPKLNDFQLSQLLTLEFYKRVQKPLLHYTQAVHKLRPLTKPFVQHFQNYYCYNGSAHLKVTDDDSAVTCALCLEAMKPKI